MITLAKRLTLVAILATNLFALSKAQAQTPQWQWAQKAGGTSNSYGYDVAVDASGNSYVTGYFRDTATFGSVTLTSSGSEDIFVAKYDASGTVLWAQKAGGIASDEGNSIAVDASGNSYVTGYFQGTATFGSTTLTSSGDRDVFVAKYDASGTVLWAQKAGGTNFDQGNDIALDASGNSYVTGYFQSTATFGSDTLTSSGDFDVFVAKYDASGTVLWVRKAGGTGGDYGSGIAVDASGNSYVTGYFRDTTTFGSTTLTSSGSEDIFVAKYDASGTVLWAQKAGGTSGDIGNGIAIDASGNSYITGNFQDTATFGSTTLTSGGNYDVFVAKYDASGTVLWARKAGGTGFDDGQGIAVDASGNSYVTGYFRDTTTFGSVTLTSSGDFDVFVAKYDTSGAVLWARNAGGTSTDAGYGIAVDASGNSYVTGEFRGTATFGSDTLTSGGGNDVFVAKLGSTNPTAISSIDETQAISIYPNPAKGQFTIQTSQEGEKELRILDATGKQMSVHRFANAQQTITTEGLPAGLYILQLVQDGRVSTQRLVKH